MPRGEGDEAFPLRTQRLSCTGVAGGCPVPLSGEALREECFVQAQDRMGGALPGQSRSDGVLSCRPAGRRALPGQSRFGGNLACVSGRGLGLSCQKPVLAHHAPGCCLFLGRGGNRKEQRHDAGHCPGSRQPICAAGGRNGAEGAFAFFSLRKRKLVSFGVGSSGGGI